METLRRLRGGVSLPKLLSHERNTGSVSWHLLTDRQALDVLCSSPDGLSEADASDRQKSYGPNILPSRPPPSALTILLHQFLSPLIYILLAAGIVSAAIGDVVDSCFIFGVVLLNALLGAYQEWRAERSAAALQSLLRVVARVRRAAVETDIPSQDLVPGDIVRLETGNRVPADLRLLFSKNLEVDESLLTGESVAVRKTTGALHRSDLAVSEISNMVFGGSTIVAGRATGIVVAIGRETEVGRIAGSVIAAETAKPPLLIRMEKFGRQISALVMAACALLAFIAISRGFAVLDVFFMSVALAVSAIPEGLPVAITVCLSIATSRLAKRNVIVRRLTAVEGLGSCTYIASDKTGTLTMNEQTVRLVVLPSGDRFAVSGAGYSGHGSVTAVDGIVNHDVEETLEQLGRAGIICNEASLRFSDGEWQRNGDAVDIALLALGYKLGLNPDNVRGDILTVADIPFESERGYAAQFYRAAGKLEVAAKGAPEVILTRCAVAQTRQGRVPVDRRAAERLAETLSGSGYRVIALASKEIKDAISDPDPGPEHLQGLTLLGFVALIDPPRPEARSAVEKCRQAGVRVAMVTGDHPQTAFSVARDLGISESPLEVVTGRDLASIPPEEGDTYLGKVNGARVFARVTPLQKLEIVEALTNLGHFVAVTGDGVNDAPALRKANIGVAMGSGSDVAKDVASLIITDDNFASIEGGVEEGRFAYDNIRKVTYLLISTGAAEVVLFLLALISGVPIPLLPVQLLWLNLVTNGIQDVALAFEGGEPGAMRRPPRKPTEGIFNRLMIQQTVVAATTMALVAFVNWQLLLSMGLSESEARNRLLLLMVLLENFHVFNCRSEYVSAFRIPLRRNVWLAVGVVAAQALHVLSMHLSLMQTVLHVGPLSFGEWPVPIAMASTVLIAVELFKLARRRSESRAGQPG